ncbi:hypothetical protein [Arcanobacterium hippocoleae]|uniref:Uncharacterized protein n=1 Tax=Arcanobacterium hippocoleae TaxID=149017 RepID=A0ABU1T1Z4_9ACTO|nr:hypothetical protein [Arcanobacterium hippocoleae]MDR6939400.1 hypothetical protein [Arcanobacterium hippocoleae]
MARTLSPPAPCQLAGRQAELETAFTAMVAHNQHVATDQDEYAKQIQRIEQDYNQAADRLKTLEAQITERQAKHHALLATFDQLASQPISEFQPTQWTALIDHAIVGTGSIEFFFRDGRRVTINL